MESTDRGKIRKDVTWIPVGTSRIVANGDFTADILGGDAYKSTETASFDSHKPLTLFAKGAVNATTATGPASIHAGEAITIKKASIADLIAGGDVHVGGAAYSYIVSGGNVVVGDAAHSAITAQGSVQAARTSAPVKAGTTIDIIEAAMGNLTAGGDVHVGKYCYNSIVSGGDVAVGEFSHGAIDAKGSVRANTVRTEAIIKAGKAIDIKESSMAKLNAGGDVNIGGHSYDYIISGGNVSIGEEAAHGSINAQGSVCATAVRTHAPVKAGTTITIKETSMADLTAGGDVYVGGSSYNPIVSGGNVIVGDAAHGTIKAKGSVKITFPENGLAIDAAKLYFEEGTRIPGNMHTSVPPTLIPKAEWENFVIPPTSAVGAGGGADKKLLQQKVNDKVHY